MKSRVKLYMSMFRQLVEARWPAYQFKFVNDEDGDMLVYWHRSLLSREFYQVTSELKKQGKCLECSSLEELGKNPDYIAARNQMSPIMKAKLSEGEANQIESFCSARLVEPVEKPQGKDGHRFIITFFNPDERYECWCNVPYEWKKLVDIIDICILHAGLKQSDEEVYYRAFYWWKEN